MKESELKMGGESLDSVRDRKEKTRSLEELLKLANEKGSPDLFELSQVERATILNWYKNSDLSEKEEVDFLEEFMRYDLVDDEVAFKLIKLMQPEQKKQIGEYLGRAVKPGKYLRAFYNSWHELGFETQQEFARKFLVENPEGALMVAPFKDFTRIKTEEIKENSGAEVSKKSLLEAKFISIENSKTLLNALLQYYEDSYEERSFYSTEARNMNEVISYYFKNKLVVLYPYLEKLYDLGFIKEEEVDAFFDFEKRYQYPDLRDSTKEEEIEISKLTKKLFWNNEKVKEEGFYYLSEVSPRKQALKIDEIRDRGLTRAANNILHNFKEYKAKFNFNSDKFLLGLLDRDIPVFSMIEFLGLTKEEARNIILRSYEEIGNFPFRLSGLADMKSVLDWNRGQKEGPDLEKIIAGLILKEIGESENMNVIIKFNQILGWFSEQNRNKIIKSVNQKTPQLWLLNLNYAIKNNVMPLDILLQKSTKQDDLIFLRHFNNILYHINILKKEGKETPIELDKIKKTARKIIFKNPHYFFYKEFKNTVQKVLNEDEQLNFISNELNKRPVDQHFFVSLIHSDELKKFSKVCREALLTDSGLFSGVIVRTKEKLIGEVLSFRDATDLFIKNVDFIDFNDVFGVINEKLVLNFLEHPKQFDSFLSALHDSKNAAGLILLAKNLNSIQETDETNLKTWENNIKRMKEDIGRCVELKNFARLKEEKERFQLKINKLKTDVSELEKKKPKGRSDELKRSTISYNKRVKEDLKTFCESDKFLIFQGEILNVLGEDGFEIARSNAEEYMSTHPEALLRRSFDISGKGFDKLIFKKILGEEKFSELFKSKIRALAFWSGRHGMNIDTEELPKDLAAEVKSKNPILEILSEKYLEKDFYQTVINKIKNFEFYPLYADILEKIAAQEFSVYGPKLDMVFFQPREEFSELVKIMSLFEDSDLALKNKDSIFNLPAEQKEEFVKTLEFIIIYHLDKDINFDLGHDEYLDIKQKMLSRVLEFSKKLFEAENIEIIINDFIDTRTINALSIFYNNSCRENPNMKKAFHVCISQILSGNYKNWRVWGSEETPSGEPAKEKCFENLKKDELLPRKMLLDQYEKWLSDENFDFSEIFTYQISDIQSSVKDILSLAIIDGHIEKESVSADIFVVLSKYEELIRPLRNLVKRQQEFKKRIQAAKKMQEAELTDEEKQEYENLKNRIREYRDENDEDIKKIEALRYIDRVKKISLEELELKAIFIDRKKIPFSEVFKTLEDVFRDKPDFLSDIRRLRDLLTEGNKQIFQEGRVSRANLDITDRVDLKTHVFLGEEPVETCQHYESSDYNAGLLSYISDPAIKIIQIRDEKGKIIARAVMRLMEDENQNPQLFMERVYSVNAHPKIKEAMIKFGAEKAKLLGINFYTQEKLYEDFEEDKEEKEEKIVLYSQGSRSPFIYTDAGGGKIPNGIFKVEVYS